jgi:hypothetical protein
VVTVSIAVEGRSDVAAAQKILASRSISVDQAQIFIASGKSNLDKKIASYNKAALHSPWFVLRDSDHDEGDCVVTLRQSRLPLVQQNDGLCFRVAARSLEAWLMADVDAFAKFFSVAASVVPGDVEELHDPKRSLVEICRRSRKSEIKRAMVPPKGSTWAVGPEYVTWISEYALTAWRPDQAACNAPSLARALREIDKLISSGVWR